MDLSQTIQPLVVISWLNNHNNHHTPGYLHLFWFIGSRSYGYGPLSKNHFNHTHPGPKRCFILSQKGLFRQFYPVLAYGFKSIDRPKSHKREHRSLPLSQSPNGRPNGRPQIPTKRKLKKPPPQEKQPRRQKIQRLKQKAPQRKSLHKTQQGPFSIRAISSSTRPFERAFLSPS